MSARHLIDQLTEAVDETNLCVVLRPGEDGLEALIVYDEQDRPSIPGGHAKGSESHAQAAKREVKEETDLDVEPQQLFWAKHAARGPGRHCNLFYATVGEFEEGKPGGGDVTRLYWAPVTNLGELNGTDRLAIHIAANRVHSPQAVVDDAVELGEALGYAVGTVAAPPPEVPGLYIRLGGEAANEFALKLKAWAESLSWPVTLVSSRLCESSKDALARASKNRRLTPMLEAVLLVADTHWRYESEISPALAQGHIVIETGPMVIDVEHLKKRGLPSDLLNEVASRVRLPKLYFGVGESFNLAMLQIIQDGIEKLQEAEVSGGRFLMGLIKRLGRKLHITNPKKFQHELAAKVIEIAKLVKPFHYSQACSEIEAAFSRQGIEREANPKSAAALTLIRSPQAKEALELAIMDFGFGDADADVFASLVEEAIAQFFGNVSESANSPDPDNPEHYLNRLKTAIQCPKCKETRIAAHAIGPQQGFLDPTAACSHCGHRDVRSAFYRRIDIE